MPEKKPLKKPLQFGIFTTKPHRVWAVGAITAVFIASMMSRVHVVILRNLTDAVTAVNIDVSAVWFWGLAYPAFFFLAESVWRMSGFTGMRWFMGMRSTAYTYLYNYLTRHSKDYFDGKFAGSLTNKISNAVDGSERLFVQSLWQFFPTAMSVMWYTIFAWTSDWRLGAIVILWSALFFSVNFWFVRRIEPYSYKFAQSISSLKGRIVDSLTNISLVHEYAHVAREQKYIEKFIEKQRTAGITNWWKSEWVLVTNGALIAGFMVLMLGSSISFYLSGAIQLGSVIMVIAIVNDLAHTLFFIGMQLAEATKNYGQAKEGLEEILGEHAIVDHADATTLEAKKGVITIESIGFEYGSVKVFDDFSLAIPTGQKVGLVGRSGAGKSTLVALLLRHFDLQKGTIKIDGQDISRVTLDSLRRAIAFVPQDTSLFHRTIGENIRYSEPEAPGAQVEEAAKLAHAHEFIKGLEEGYDTLVGERGVRLSGGQRQRIAIARAFLKKAPILILDEATSSLDSKSEEMIQKSLGLLMEGKTVIAIAHRLSTLKRMDRIVIIEDGEILEDGSPDDLLKKKDGIFKTMWNHQVSGFIVDEA